MSQNTLNVEAAEVQPDYPLTLAYVRAYAEQMPSMFLQPPNEPLIQQLAGLLVTKNYMEACKVGGPGFLDGILLQWEHLERYEECALIRAALPADYYDATERGAAGKIPPPTIWDAVLGWGLSRHELVALLESAPGWQDLGPERRPTGEEVLCYNRPGYGYAQCWEYDPAGQMQEIRLLVPDDAPHLLQGFLAGSVQLGDFWVYPTEIAAKPNAVPRVYVVNNTSMTVLHLLFDDLTATSK